MIFLALVKQRKIELYELQELDGVTPSLGEGGESQSHLEIAKDSGSDLPPSGSVPVSGSVSLESNLQCSQIRRSERGIIFCHRFETERESFMHASCDLDELVSYNH
jgi:hypothetical protein